MTKNEIESVSERDAAVPYSEVLRHSQRWINKVKQSTDRLNLAGGGPVE